MLKKNFLTPLVNLYGRRVVEPRLPDPPVIIGGCGRSGTSLLLSILAAHPKIYALPEETGMLKYWHEIRDAESDAVRYRAARIDRMYRHTLLHPIPKQATRWCEKSPLNVRHLEQILSHFGDHVRFIHIIRDGRDVLTSRHPWAPEAYWVTPQRWVDDVRSGLRFHDDPRVYTLRYEDLIYHHEASLLGICEFIGEDLVPEMKNWHESSPVQDNRAWFGPLQKVHDRSVRKWASEEHQDRILEVMADAEVVRLLEDLGYLDR
jgi:sulfotransferase family protein